MSDQPNRPVGQSTPEGMFASMPAFRGDPVPNPPADASPSPAPENREVWLARLKGQQFRHWTSGLTILVEVYCERDERLRSDRGAQVELLVQERELRRKRGQKPTLAEFAQRFPDLVEDLRQAFAERDEAERPTTAAESAPPADTAASDPHGPTVASGGPASLRGTSDVAPPGYELLGELGRGGMGVVYKARQTALKRMVALKMIISGARAGPEEIARFRTEASAVAALQHPNIVQVYDFGEFNGAPFFTLEFVDGGSLASVLNGSPQPPLQCALWMLPLSQAIQAAHEVGVVHRDLKPANILLMADGTPKIADFGLAKKMDSSSGWTRTGDIMGTPCYMSPEQAEGRLSQIGPPSDIYALGAILYEMLTGKPPFIGKTTIETLDLVRTAEPVPPCKVVPKIPKDLETICLKCLEKDPNQRYLTAQALAEDLKRFLRDQPILAKPAGVLNRASRWYSRNRAVVVLGTFATILFVAFVALMIYLIADANKRGTDGQTIASASVTEPAGTAAKQPTASASLPATLAKESPPPPPPITPPPATAPVPGVKPIMPPPVPVAPTVAKVMPKPADVPPPKPEPVTVDRLVAQARASKDPAARAALYVQAWDLAEKEGKSLSDPATTMQDIVLPGLAQAEAAGPSAAQAGSRLWAAKGRLLYSNPKEDWKLPEGQDPFRVASEAFEKAIHYPGVAWPPRELAQLHAFSGFALTKVKEVTRAEQRPRLDVAAKAAIQADPTYAGGYALRGLTSTLDAFAEFPLLSRGPWAEKYRERLQAAADDFAQAIKFHQQGTASVSDDFLIIYHYNRSMVLSRLASLQANPEDRESLLQQAEEAALAATKIDSTYLQAWNALGIAREARGLSGQAEAWPAARTAFTKAVQIAEENALPTAEPLAKLGRFLATWSQQKDAPADLAQAARDTLQKAIQANPHNADAHFYLATLTVSQNKDQALKSYRIAVSHPDSGVAYFRVLLSQPPAGFTRKDLLALAEAALPAERQPQHAFVLQARARLMIDPEATPEQFQASLPQIIAAASTAVDLAAQGDPAVLALCLEAKVEGMAYTLPGLLEAAANDPRKLEQVRTVTGEIENLFEQALSADPDLPMANRWFDQLSRLHARLAGYDSQPRDQRLADARKALEWLRRCIAKSPRELQQGLLRRRDQLQTLIADLQKPEPAKK